MAPAVLPVAPPFRNPYYRLRSEKGYRLYSQDDVGRLALIKRLVDGGDAISRVANLDKDELAERAKGVPLPELGAEQERICRVAVLGGALTEKLGRAKGGMTNSRS